MVTPRQLHKGLCAVGVGIEVTVVKNRRSKEAIQLNLTEYHGRTGEHLNPFFFSEPVFLSASYLPNISSTQNRCLCFFFMNARVVNETSSDETGRTEGRLFVSVSVYLCAFQRVCLYVSPPPLISPLMSFLLCMLSCLSVCLSMILTIYLSLTLIYVNSLYI